MKQQNIQWEAALELPPTVADFKINYLYLRELGNSGEKKWKAQTRA